jgi:hypothetical protein
VLRAGTGLATKIPNRGSLGGMVRAPGGPTHGKAPTSTLGGMPSPRPKRPTAKDASRVKRLRMHDLGSSYPL